MQYGGEYLCFYLEELLSEARGNAHFVYKPTYFSYGEYGGIEPFMLSSLRVLSQIGRA